VGLSECCVEMQSSVKIENIDQLCDSELFKEVRSTINLSRVLRPTISRGNVCAIK
jgi:hypothetical protein